MINTLKRGALWLTVLALMLTLTGTGMAEGPAQADGAYQPLLDHLYAVLRRGATEEMPDDLVGLWEVLRWFEVKEALARIGYRVFDFSGDNSPELLIGAIQDSAGESTEGGGIYALYTLVAGQPQLVFEGWERNRYSYLGGGTFFNQASEGAIRSAFGVYQLSADGRTLVCQDFYFTDEKDGKPGEMGLYHNTTGEWDQAVSEALTISEAAFWKLEAGLLEKAQPLRVSPFWDHKPLIVPAVPLTLSWAQDEAALSPHDKLISDWADNAVKLLITATEPLWEFELFSLTFSDATCDGSMAFDSKTLYEQALLSPDRPLVVRYVVQGDLPTIGLSYVDAVGVEQVFAVEISGEDGRPLLSPLAP